MLVVIWLWGFSIDVGCVAAEPGPDWKFTAVRRFAYGRPLAWSPSTRRPG